MQKSDQSVRSVAGKLGRAKSQVHRDMLAGKVTPENAESVGDLHLRKLALEVEERKRRVELQQIKIDEARRELVPSKDVAEIVTRILAICTSSVDFALLSRLPQLNAGLDAAQQRASNESECNEVRRRIRDEASEFLKNFESRK